MRLFLFCLFALTICRVQSQNMRFTHLDQKQGLSQNTATAFIRDREGFVWVGTQDGLNQYDGYSFKVYRNISGDTNSLCDNFILSLAEDKQGNIWVGTRNGLCVYSKTTGQFYRYYSSAQEKLMYHSSVKMLFALRDSGIIYASENSDITLLHFSLLEKGQPDFTVLGSIPVTRRFSYCAATNQLAYISNQKIIFCDASTLSVTHNYDWKPVSREPSVLLLTEQGLYINDNLDVLLFYSRPGQGPYHIYHSDAGITTLSKDSAEQLWIGTVNGLRIIDSRPDCALSGITATENSSDFFSLIGKHVEAIYISQENLVWIGTVGAVNIYDPRQKLFTHPGAGIQGFSSEEAIWFVLAAGRITLFANDENFSYESENGYAPAWVKAIPTDLHCTAGCFDSHGRLWLGTKGAGIFIIDTTTLRVENKFFRSPLLNGYTIMDMCETSSGKMWVASIGWLGTINTLTYDIETITSRESLRRNITNTYFTAIEEDGKGNVYVSSAAGLLCLHDKDTMVQKYQHDPSRDASLGYNIINDIELSGNHLWIATMGSGLDRLDLITSTFTHYTTSNGLANNTIYGIEIDSRENLWLGTNEGIVNYNPASGTSRNYTMRDGLPSNEFVINKHSQNISDGRIYFGSSRGVVGFNPIDFAESSTGVSPIISRILVNFEERTNSPDSVLILQPNERNITLAFSAIDYRNQDKITYEYRLIGFDSTWRPASAGNRTAVFTNLPYGEYSFEVRYRISGEPWSENILRKSILIQTPFYATMWFRTVLVLSGIIIIALIVRYISQRKLRIQLAELRLQEQIRNEKERISRDLHDNVGAQLTYVISSLDNLSYSLQKKHADKESEKLEQLGEFARGTMDQLRESIWAINAEHISLSELGGRWKQYLSQLTESRPAFKGTVIIQGTDNLLKPTVAIEIHRIVQEAITNAFKHSGGDQVEVSVTSNGSFTLRIKDNGKGFEGTEKDGHYGIKNMRDRARLVGATLEFRGNEFGTEITLCSNDSQTLP